MTGGDFRDRSVYQPSAGCRPSASRDWRPTAREMTSGAADVGEEGADARPELLGLLAQLVRRAQHLDRSRPGFLDDLVEAGDVARHFRGAARGLLDVAGDLLG